MPVKRTHKRPADEMLRIRVSRDEKAAVESRAAMQGLTVAGFLRQAVGLPVRQRGGAMPGAGRPRNAHEKAPN